MCRKVNYFYLGGYQDRGSGVILDNMLTGAQVEQLVTRVWPVVEELADGRRRIRRELWRVAVRSGEEILAAEPGMEREVLVEVIRRRARQSE